MNSQLQNQENFNFNEAVFAAVRKIPAGRVATYGQIAAIIGRPRAARAVGNTLHYNPYEPGAVPDELAVPCHRVVNAQGRLADAFSFAGPIEQKIRLNAEGVEVSADYRVDLKKYGI